MLRERGRLAAREHLAAIGDFIGVDRPPQRLHNIDFHFAKHCWQIIAFLHADAVLASDRSAEIDAERQDLARQRLGSFQRAGFASVVQNQRMQIAIARMEDVGYVKLVLCL